MKAIVTLYTLAFLLLFAIRCTYDNELDLTPCPDQPNFTLLSLQNTSCGASVGSFEVQIADAGNQGSYGDEASDPGFQYSIGDGSFQNEGFFDNLSAGTYNVVASLRTGCEFTEAVVVENEAGLQVETTTEDDDCAKSGSGKILARPMDAIGAVTFSLDNGIPQSNGMFDNLSAGTYTLNVADEGGCSVAQEITIKAEIDPQVIYTLVSENCATSACHGGSQAPNLSSDQNIEDRKARILSRTSNRTMPPSSSGMSLTEEHIDLIKCWADQ